MKATPLLMLMVLVALAACQPDGLLEADSDDAASARLNDQPTLLKISYIEEAQRRAEFPEGAAEKYGMTYLEEPKSERKQVYIEVYRDLSYSQQVEYLPTRSDFPADDWRLPDDMPRVQRFTYINGAVRGYDAQQNLIYEDTYEPRPWVDPGAFASLEAAQDFAVATYYEPQRVAGQAMALAKAGADSHTETERGLVLTQQLEMPVAPPPAARTDGRTVPEVTSEKVFVSAEHGLVYRTEGYTARGDFKDLEHNFFEYTEDSVLHLASSHYRNKQYSAAYDVTFVEYSDIFYTNFVIQTSR